MNRKVKVISAILISILALGLVGVGIWFLFVFTPKDDLTSFVSMGPATGPTSSPVTGSPVTPTTAAPTGEHDVQVFMDQFG